MKAMKCELCGSNDLIKKDGLYECQYCQTKYTPDEAKKLLVEITGEVTVKNMGDIDSYLKLAQSANEAKNYKDTENYCNKILEIDINNYETWLMKGSAVGWQSTIANIRTLESVKCFENAITYAPDDKKEEVTNTSIAEIKKLLESLGNLACSFFDDNPTDYNAKTILDVIPKIISDINQFVSFANADFNDVMTQLGKNIDKTVMRTYHNKILVEYNGSNKRPSQYQFEEFITITMCSVYLEESAIACIVGESDEDKKTKIGIYQNEIEILEARGKACSWTKTYNGGFESWQKEYTLNKEAKKENANMINEIRQKIKDLNPEGKITAPTHENESNIERKHKNVGWWIVFSLFVINILGGTSTYPAGTLVIFTLIALICCPPLIDKLKSKGYSISTKARIWAIFILFFIASIITGSSTLTK